jgi:putative transposase
VSIICPLIDVESRNYYSYLKRTEITKFASDHGDLIEMIQKISEASDHTYGSRRIQKKLTALSFPIGRWKTARLMKEAGVWVRYKKKYKVTTNSEHKKPIFKNELKQNFKYNQPNRAYVGDITYVWSTEGWLYLAVVIDLYSRKVVGWSMSSRMKASLVCDALSMAICQRNPPPGLIVHSDQGVQYASDQYRRLLKTHQLVGSMSKKGCCWDNAVAESFFGSLKQERVHWNNYATRYEAQQDILNYITMWYNSNRLHSYLGYRCPNAFEMMNGYLKKVA